jgi:hypothetical protein
LGAISADSCKLVGVALLRFYEDDAGRNISSGENHGEESTMNNKVKLLLGTLTALSMLVLTLLLPRGSAMKDAVLVQFPITVGIWAIFVLLFVKLK